VTLTNWNWLLEKDVQDYPWDCSAASTAWALRTIGYHYTEQDVIAGLGPTRITPMYGLMDASGAGLVEWLAEIGVNADNNPSASWEELVAAAGWQPMVIGGREWCHWVAVRMGPSPAPDRIPNVLALMNPAPGYMDVDQVLEPDDLARLGSFSAVWFNSW
jgi:hypothetical protein